MPNSFVKFDLTWNGGRISTKIAAGGARGVNKALEYLRAKSVPLAPIDTGALRESATVQQATGTKAEGALIFDTPYAAAQHEDESFHHDDGQAHYVSEPLADGRDNMNRLIAREISVELNG